MQSDMDAPSARGNPWTPLSIALYALKALTCDADLAIASVVYVAVCSHLDHGRIRGRRWRAQRRRVGYQRDSCQDDATRVGLTTVVGPVLGAGEYRSASILIPVMPDESKKRRTGWLLVPVLLLGLTVGAVMGMEAYQWWARYLETHAIVIDVPARRDQSRSSSPR